MMGGNPIIVETDLEVSVSSSSRGEMKYESHFFSFVSGGYESGIIILSDGYEMEDLSIESM